MKYNVNINQAGVADAGLAKATDFIDWAIISYIHDWQTAPKAARVGDMVWINYKHLIDEMPLLGLNSKTSISSRMSKLKELGLIEVGYDKDKRLYARISDRCHEIILFRSDCTPNSGGVRQDVHGVRCDVQGGVRQDVHSTVNYISTDNQDSISAGAEKDCAKNAHTHPPIAKKKPSATNQEFDAFWGIYPKKVAKGAAIRAFGSAMKISTFSEIMDGVRRYAQTGPDPKYTPHPATWLNQQRWADEIKQESNGKAINRSNANPTKTDRLDAAVQRAIDNSAHWAELGMQISAGINGQAMLPGPQSVREGAGTDRGVDQCAPDGAGAVYDGSGPRGLW